MTVIYRIALATFMGFALTVAIASHSIAQQQQLIGTWLLVSEITEFPDGKRLEGFGGNQKGILIFDRTGHYSSQLTGASRIKFASTRLQGTPEENKGVSAGSLAHFGRYSVDAAVQPSRFMWSAARSRIGMTRIKNGRSSSSRATT